MHVVVALPDAVESGASLGVQLLCPHRAAAPHLHSVLGMASQLGEVSDNAVHPTLVKIRISSHARESS